ncbi:MAG: hypothetical protein LBK25_01425, partial [Treponema sp.]|nr:hypothetical protein [Treponema sp.]
MVSDTGLLCGVRRRLNAGVSDSGFTAGCLTAEPTAWCQTTYSAGCQTSAYAGGVSRLNAVVSDTGLTPLVSVAGLLRGVRHRLTSVRRINTAWCQPPAYAVVSDAVLSAVVSDAVLSAAGVRHRLVRHVGVRRRLTGCQTPSHGVSDAVLSAAGVRHRLVRHVGVRRRLTGCQT